MRSVRGTIPWSFAWQANMLANYTNGPLKKTNYSNQIASWVWTLSLFIGFRPIFHWRLFFNGEQSLSMRILRYTKIIFSHISNIQHPVQSRFYNQMRLLICLIDFELLVVTNFLAVSIIVNILENSLYKSYLSVTCSSRMIRLTWYLKIIRLYTHPTTNLADEIT